MFLSHNVIVTASPGLCRHRHSASPSSVRHTVFLHGPWQLPPPHDSRQRTKQPPVDTQSPNDSDTKSHNILSTPTHNLPLPKIVIRSRSLIVTQTCSLLSTCVHFGTTSQTMDPPWAACIRVCVHPQPPRPIHAHPGRSSRHMNGTTELGPEPPPEARAVSDAYNTSTAAQMATSLPILLGPMR